MRRSTSTLLLAALCLLAPAAGCVAPSTRPAVSATHAEVVAHRGGPHPATQPERQRYQDREKQASGLEEFEGGRGAYVAASTIIIVLLVVLIVIIVV